MRDQIPTVSVFYWKIAINLCGSSTGLWAWKELAELLDEGVNGLGR